MADPIAPTSLRTTSSLSPPSRHNGKRRQSLAVTEIVAPSTTVRNQTTAKLNEFYGEKLAQNRHRLIKLYGRDEEIKLLREELTKVCQEKRRSLVLVHGLKGQGKSSLMRQLEQPSKAKGAIFVDFSWTAHGEPYNGVKAAVRQLAIQLDKLPKRNDENGDGKTLEALQKLMSKKLEWELNLLCQVFPELSILTASSTRDKLLQTKNIAKARLRNYSTRSTATSKGSVTTGSAYPSVLRDPNADDALKGNAASAPQRLQFAFMKVLQVLTSFAPLILVGDDACLADTESLRVFQGFLNDTLIEHFFLGLSYRSDLVGPKDPLQPALTKLKENSTIPILDMPLRNPSLSDVNSMITDLLDVPSPDDTQELTQIIYHKTLGNILDVLHYLSSLAERGHLEYSLTTNSWSWNVENVRQSLTATDSVVQWMKQKLHQSKLAKEILPIAACLGEIFDLWVLQTIMDGIQRLNEAEEKQGLEICKKILGTTEVISEKQMEKLEVLGLLEDNGLGTYSFIHEEVMEGALDIVGDSLDNLKFALGCILYDQMELLHQQRQEEVLFLVVNLLNVHLETIPPNRKKAVLEINIAAGDEAHMAAAFQQSSKLYRAAIELLPEDHWNSMDEVSLHLYTAAAEAEMCLGNYDQMDVFIKIVLERDNIELLQKMPVIETQLNALLAQKLVKRAWEEALKILDQVGAHFHTHGTRARTAWAIAQLKMNPRQWKPEALSKLPVSEDPMDEEIAKIHDRQIEMALMVQPAMFPWTIFNAVQHVLDRGLTRYSASVLAWFGVLLCGVLGDFQWGNSNMKFVYSLLERFDNRLVEPRAIVVSALNVAHWTNPLHDVKKSFTTVYSKGMETSDMVTAFWGAFFYHEDAFCSGTNLDMLAKDAELYGKQMAEYGMLNHLQNLLSVQNLISELRGTPGPPGWKKPESVGTGLKSNFCHAMKDQLIGAAFFGDWETGAELGQKHVDFIGEVLLGQFSSVVSPFITSLCCFEVARRHHGIQKQKYLHAATKNYKAVHAWCDKGNPNTQHYLLLLKAERENCNGHNDKAVALYRQAILFAGRSGFNHDQALACERLAALYIRSGDKISAKYSLEDALRLYEEWGAAKKVELLKKEIAEMV